MKKSLILVSAFFLLAIAACRQASAPLSKARQFSDEQLQAKFPADLGPNAVDVSRYPAEQRENYEVFARKCSECHTLARPINSTYVEEDTWKRYVQRMYGKAHARFHEPLLTEKEAKQVSSFLAYDSHERKVVHAQDFTRSQGELKELFDAMVQELTRVQVDEGLQKAREPAPDVGDRR